MLQADPLEHLVGPTALLFDGRAEHTQREADVLENCFAWNEFEVLKDEAHGTPVGLHLAGRHPHQVSTVDDGNAFGGTLLQQQQPQ